MSKRYWVGVFEYPSHGRRYYRLQWGHGEKILGYIHIKGGCSQSIVAQTRAAELEACINAGVGLYDLIAIAKNYGSAKRGPKAF
jgi:hypothetical protein